MNELVELVEQWSKEKGLDKADSSKQMLKVVEETGEVAAALARNDRDAWYWRCSSNLDHLGNAK